MVDGVCQPLIGVKIGSKCLGDITKTHDRFSRYLLSLGAGPPRQQSSSQYAVSWRKSRRLLEALPARRHMHMHMSSYAYGPTR